MPAHVEVRRWAPTADAADAKAAIANRKEFFSVVPNSYRRKQGLGFASLGLDVFLRAGACGVRTIREVPTIARTCRMSVQPGLKCCTSGVRRHETRCGAATCARLTARAGRVRRASRVTARNAKTLARRAASRWQGVPVRDLAPHTVRRPAKGTCGTSAAAHYSACFCPHLALAADAASSSLSQSPMLPPPPPEARNAALSMTRPNLV